MPSLILFYKGEPILRENLVSSLTIGSSEDNDICLLDSVTPHHARIEITEKGTFLVTQEGQLFVNGERIAGSRPLKPGDLFDLGAYRVHLIESSAPEAFWKKTDKTLTVSLQGKEKGGAIPVIHFLDPLQKKFRKPHLSIGRSPACDLVIHNSYVSSEHAELFVRDGTYYLRDLHSRNGTFVNDYRVTERPLPRNGTIRLGRWSVPYEIETSPVEGLKDIEGISLPPLTSGAQRRMIVGQSAPFTKLMQKLKKVAPTDDSVLLLGETGVGKDLLAQYLHSEHPKRRSRPFVAVNCATIPATLADSQLFGHMRGAFTGAVTDQKGYFEQAHGGTLFLDEIGDLPLESQARLLRIIEDGIIRPIGATRDLKVDVRVILATNRNLDTSRHEGTFREDLYQRFDWIFHIPSLKERRDDIPLLLRYFLSQHSPEPLTLHPDLDSALQSSPWPGNIRQLHRAVRRAITLALARGSSTLEPEDFPEDFKNENEKGNPSTREIRQSKRRKLAQTLKSCDGNISKTARELGVSRVTIHNWIRER